ncbi:MAG: amino acid--tRNA ligase-related protein [Candidatus Saccharimonadales bacterium]
MRKDVYHDAVSRSPEEHPSVSSTTEAEVSAGCYDKPDNKESIGTTIHGRVVATRTHKTVRFFDLRSETGIIQVVDEAGQGSTVDSPTTSIKRGDFIEVFGVKRETLSGNMSMFANSIILLQSADTPIPTVREFDQQKAPPRYLQLLMNDDAREAIITRAVSIQKIRSHLSAIGMLEIDTPIVNTHYNGGVSRPFTTKHHALRSEAYLRSSSELYLKQMIIAGLEGVFEIGKQFRNEGLSNIHNPEFTALEMYHAYKDNTEMQQNLQQLLRTVTDDTDGIVSWRGGEIDLNVWRKAPIKTLTAETLSLDDDSTFYIVKHARSRGLQGTDDQIVVALFEKFVKKQLIQPTFVTHLPASLSPMTKKDDSDPTVALSYKGYIGGMSLIDGSYEETDARTQIESFTEQSEIHRTMGMPAYPRHMEFVEALRYGMPPLAGASLSVDRLMMLITGQETIANVLPDRAKRPK